MKANRRIPKGYTLTELLLVIAFLTVTSVIGVVAFLMIKILWKLAFQA